MNDPLLGPGQHWELWPLNPLRPKIAREIIPNKPETWGYGCARGIEYRTVGAPVASGTRGVVRKITAGRKKGKNGKRALSSDSLL